MIDQPEKGVLLPIAQQRWSTRVGGLRLAFGMGMRRIRTLPISRRPVGRGMRVVLLLIGTLMGLSVGGEVRARTRPGFKPAAPRVRVLASAEGVAHAAARTFVHVVRDASAKGRRAMVALSGGTTPRRLFQLLATEYASQVEWGAVELFFSDERAVAPNDPASNYGAVRSLLLDHVPIPAGQIHRMRGDSSDLGASARAYEALIRARVPGVGTPRFDLVWLGLGSDGHIASLFSGSRAIDEHRALVVSTLTPHGPRLTFTPRLLSSTRRLQFLATGADKAGIVHAVLAGTPRSGELPASRIALAAGARAEWLLDAESGSLRVTSRR